MYSSPFSHRVTSRLHTPAQQSVDKGARLEALAQLVEDGIPNLKSKDERHLQFARIESLLSGPAVGG